MLTSPSSTDLRPTLSHLWVFAILNMLFRDVHEFTMASTINEILSGTLNGNPMSEQVLLAGAFAVELLLLAFLLTALFPPRWSRLLNLVMVPVAVAGIFVVPPADPDDYFFATVVLITLATIFVLAWRWNPLTTASAKFGASHAA